MQNVVLIDNYIYNILTKFLISTLTAISYFIVFECRFVCIIKYTSVVPAIFKILGLKYQYMRLATWRAQCQITNVSIWAGRLYLCRICWKRWKRAYLKTKKRYVVAFRSMHMWKYNHFIFEDSYISSHISFESNPGSWSWIISLCQL